MIVWAIWEPILRLTIVISAILKGISRQQNVDLLVQTVAIAILRQLMLSSELVVILEILKPVRW